MASNSRNAPRPECRQDAIHPRRYRPGHGRQDRRRGARGGADGLRAIQVKRRHSPSLAGDSAIRRSLSDGNGEASGRERPRRADRAHGPGLEGNLRRGSQRVTPSARSLRVLARLAADGGGIRTNALRDAGGPSQAPIHAIEARTGAQLRRSAARAVDVHKSRRVSDARDREWMVSRAVSGVALRNAIEGTRSGGGGTSKYVKSKRASETAWSRECGRAAGGCPWPWHNRIGGRRFARASPRSGAVDR